MFVKVSAAPFPTRINLHGLRISQQISPQPSIGLVDLDDQRTASEARFITEERSKIHHRRRIVECHPLMLVKVNGVEFDRWQVVHRSFSRHRSRAIICLATRRPELSAPSIYPTNA
jgi:hypothetical protein